MLYTDPSGQGFWGELGKDLLEGVIDLAPAIIGIVVPEVIPLPDILWAADTTTITDAGITSVTVTASVPTLAMAMSQGGGVIASSALGIVNGEVPNFKVQVTEHTPHTPWYQNSCVMSALGKGALSVGLDAIGLLPEGGFVSSAFSLWHGAAGISNGTRNLRGIKVAASYVSTAFATSSVSGTNGSYANGLAGTQSALGAGSIVASFARATPVLGQALSGVSIGLDVVGTAMEVAKCE
jgi:hypothetical protein